MTSIKPTNKKIYILNKKHLTVGIGFIVVSIFALIMFAPNVEYSFLDKQKAETKAIIFKKIPTDAYDNDKPIMEYHYWFSVEGNQYKGKSYSPKIITKDTVTVFYNPDNPQQSHIEGMKSKPFGMWLIFFCLSFLVAGILMTKSSIKIIPN